MMPGLVGGRGHAKMHSPELASRLARRRALVDGYLEAPEAGV